MSKVKITEQDVGREYIARNGYKYKIAKFEKGEKYAVSIGCLNISGYIGLTENGHGNFDGRESQLDFMRWADENEKMENKIELKVGQKVKLRNGGTGKVISYGTGVLRDNPFKVHHNERGVNFWHTVSGEWSEVKGESQFDIIEVLEEPSEDKMEENLKGKYELSVTVNDVNNSCKNDKFYCLGFSELIEEVNKLTLNKICLTKFVSEQEVFEGKGDTLKLSKIIKINGKELGKVTIKISQLED